MMHVTYAEKSLLVGDAIGELISQYAAALAQHDSADTVKVRGYGADGDDVTATYLLNSGTVLMIETSHSSINEPDNSEAEQYVLDHLQKLTAQNHVIPQSYDESISGDWDPELN